MVGLNKLLTHTYNRINQQTNKQTVRHERTLNRTHTCRLTLTNLIRMWIKLIRSYSGTVLFHEDKEHIRINYTILLQIGRCLHRCMHLKNFRHIKHLIALHMIKKMLLLHRYVWNRTITVPNKKWNQINLSFFTKT